MAINQQTNPQTAAGLQLYANTVIEALSARLVAISGFARNFTSEMSQPGDTLSVPYVEGNTVGDFNASTNNFATETTEALKNIVVKLGNHSIAKFTVTPEMKANFVPAYWEAKGRLNAHAIADELLTEIAALPVSSKVTQSIQLAKDTCTINDVIDIAQKCDALNIKPREATLFLTAADYYRLLKTLTYNVTGKTVITEGDVGVGFGFAQVVCLPASIASGFVGSPNMLAIASKPYVGETVGARGDILMERLLTEPTTGLTLVETLVLNPATKVTVHNLDVWHGAEIADPKRGVKITHASV